MYEEQLHDARQLITEKRYDEAKLILENIDHPTAIKWLQKINNSGYTVNPTSIFKAQPSLVLSSEPQQFFDDDNIISIDLQAIQKIMEENGKHSRSLPYFFLGACLAVFIAAFWVFDYLNTTAISRSGTQLWWGDTQLWAIVEGSEFASMGSEPLFVISARFIIGFGISWLPVTAVLWFLGWCDRMITGK